MTQARYRLTRAGGHVDSDEPGCFAGITSTGISGRLTCRSGKRARPAHRVFFATWDDAIAAGFRPCKRCRPGPGDADERDADGRWRLASRSPS